MTRVPCCPDRPALGFRASRTHPAAPRAMLPRLTLWLVLTHGCVAGSPRVPNPARPIEEPRALHVIATGVTAAGERPHAGGTLRLPSGRSLRIDVAIQGRRYGIAYLTSQDLAALQPAEDLPPHMPEGDLPIVQGTGADRDAVVLLLFASDYLQDDLAGDRHERTTIAAENRIQRDVRDFLTQARARKLP